jgi:hypothetical protein
MWYRWHWHGSAMAKCLRIGTRPAKKSRTGKKATTDAGEKSRTGKKATTDATTGQERWATHNKVNASPGAQAADGHDVGRRTRRARHHSTKSSHHGVDGGRRIRMFRRPADRRFGRHHHQLPGNTKQERGAPNGDNTRHDHHRSDCWHKSWPPCKGT